MNNGRIKKLVSLILAVALVLAGTFSGIFAKAADVTETANKYLELQVEFPEDAAGTGGECYPYVFQIPNTVNFAAGDKLVYDVYMSRNAGGFGGITLINGGLAFHDSGAVDQNGISVHPTADVSTQAALQWYTRQIEIPANYATIDFSTLSYCMDVMIPVVLPYDASLLAGETVTIKYDNIRITDAEGNTKYMIFSGEETVLNGYFADLDGFDNVTYTVSVKEENSAGGNTGDSAGNSTGDNAGGNTGDNTGGNIGDNAGGNAELSGDSYLELKATFPKDISGTGEYYPIVFWLPNTFTFEVGDRLIYDVYMSRNAGGFGGIDLCNGDFNLRDYGTKEKLSDTKGINVHPTADVSTKAALQWYTREIQLPDAFADADFSSLPDGPAVLLPVVMPYDASLLAGETVVVKYDNIRIVNAKGETKYTIFSGNEEMVEGYLAPNLTGIPGVSYSISKVRSSSPGTGDEMPVLTVSFIMGISVALMIVLKRKKHTVL